MIEIPVRMGLLFLWVLDSPVCRVRGLVGRVAGARGHRGPGQ